MGVSVSEVVRWKTSRWFLGHALGRRRIVVSFGCVDRRAIVLQTSKVVTTLRKTYLALSSSACFARVLLRFIEASGAVDDETARKQPHFTGTNHLQTHLALHSTHRESRVRG